MASIGVTWPDQETDDEEDSEEENGGDEDSEEESETESEELGDGLEDGLEDSGPKGSGSVEGAGDSASLGKMPTKEESGSGAGVGSHFICVCDAFSFSWCSHSKWCAQFACSNWGHFSILYMCVCLYPICPYVSVLSTMFAHVGGSNASSSSSPQTAVVSPANSGKLDLVITPPPKHLVPPLLTPEAVSVPSLRYLYACTWCGRVSV